MTHQNTAPSSLEPIAILKDYAQNTESKMMSIVEHITTLERTVKQQEEQIRSLQRELENAKSKEIAVTEDFQHLLQILKRARDLGIEEKIG
jgi:type IV secretory pathway VirD2 relaxase